MQGSLNLRLRVRPSPNQAKRRRRNQINGTRVFRKKRWSDSLFSADLSISPMTINSERLKILEFSKPFMQFTMSLITKKLHTNDDDLTTFMLPYSTEVWLLTLKCLLLVAVLMYLVNFFSPYGHRSRHRHRHHAETGEEFDFYNSLWFCLACMLQQGADQTPKSFSGDF